MTAKARTLTEHFEARDGYAFSKLEGSMPLELAAYAVTRAILTARIWGFRRLLVDGSRLTGFPSPSVADRYFVVRGWVTAAERQVELSLVLQQHLIDPDRFGVAVANNLGMRSNVFSSSTEALTWLLSGEA